MWIHVHMQSYTTLHFICFYMYNIPYLHLPCGTFSAFAPRDLHNLSSFFFSRLLNKRWQRRSARSFSGSAVKPKNMFSGDVLFGQRVNNKRHHFLRTQVYKNVHRIYVYFFGKVFHSMSCENPSRCFFQRQPFTLPDKKKLDRNTEMPKMPKMPKMIQSDFSRCQDTQDFANWV